MSILEIRETLRSVVRLKPYWAESNDSFHWVSPDPSCDGTIRGQIPVEESLDVKESIDIVDENVAADMMPMHLLTWTITMSEAWRIWHCNHMISRNDIFRSCIYYFVCQTCTPQHYSNQ
jgi:hypothetical protein